MLNPRNTLIAMAMLAIALQGAAPLSAQNEPSGSPSQQPTPRPGRPTPPDTDEPVAGEDEETPEERRKRLMEERRKRIEDIRARQKERAANRAAAKEAQERNTGKPATITPGKADGKPAVPAGDDTPAAPAGPPIRVAIMVSLDEQEMGRVVVEVEPSEAPKTVANFLRYVDEGYYDGTIFHRIIDGFIMQGGGYTDPETPKWDGLHDPVPFEDNKNIKNTRGTIAMARSARMDSATSQFFINLDDNPQLDTSGWRSSAFGRVVEGLDILERLAGIDVVPGRLRDKTYLTQPTMTVRITSAKRIANNEPGELVPAAASQPVPPPASTDDATEIRRETETPTPDDDATDDAEDKSPPKR